jgi:DNA-binding response OmpR family regulator
MLGNLAVTLRSRSGSNPARSITIGGQVKLRLFGELEVWSAGQSLEVGTPRQQAVLAALVVDARRPVSIDTLVDRVWDDKLPANPVPCCTRT